LLVYPQRSEERGERSQGKRTAEKIEWERPEGGENMGRGKGSTYPVLSGDITNTSNRYIRNLKCLEIRLSLVVPNLDLSITICQLPFFTSLGSKVDP
jgi:hypothetical protein